VTKLHIIRSARIRAIAAQSTCIAALLCSVPSAAQSAAEVDITGHVAPRCWVSDPKAVVVMSTPAANARRAVCNHSVARSVSENWTVMAKLQRQPRGPLRPIPVQSAEFSSRAALEIVVSPQV
jgi:hypothetical protein